MAPTVSVWLNTSWNNKRVSPATIERYVRELPPELLGSNDLDGFAPSLPLDLLKDRVLAGLASEDPTMRRAAALLAGTWHIEAAAPQLAALLDSADGMLRDAAMDSLKKIREYREVRGAALTDTAAARRAAFEKAKALLGNADPDQRIGAALAFGALGDVAGVPLLLDLMQDGNTDVRAAAKKALEKLNAAPSAPVAAPNDGASAKQQGK
jgi:HEAT repeat protein